MNGTRAPLISVVMGVFNGEDHLVKTLLSVLEQTFTDFEFIVVDDGSTDGTADILQHYAEKDNRLRVIHQENTGLTRALIHGCSLAKGEFIARQDAGDVSLPNRLEVQARFLQENPEAVMVACGAKFVTPAGEFLYQHISPGEQLDRGLRELFLSKIKGPPHHGGTMYRRKSYSSCGGYRPHFRVAQDMDLWLRLSELGSCLGADEVLYQAVVEPGSISVKCGPEQFYFGGLAIESAKLRRAGQVDTFLFENMTPPQATAKNKKGRGNSDYYYFLASMLQTSDQVAARGYLDKAICDNPFNVKARLRKMAMSLK